LDVAQFKHITDGIKSEAFSDILKLGSADTNRIFESLLNDPSVDLKALNKMLKNPQAIDTINQLLENGGEHAL